MPTSLLDPDWTPEEIELAERLGLKARERILYRTAFGKPLLTSALAEADYMAEAWAHYDDKVQIRAIQIAFEVLHHSNPNEAHRRAPARAGEAQDGARSRSVARQASRPIPAARILVQPGRV